MHQLADPTSWDPFPPNRHFDDTRDRRDANRAIAISAIGLALTGLVELAFSLLSGSVGLLGDALHNLSDVSTSLVVLGFGSPADRPIQPTRMAMSGPRISPGWAWRRSSGPAPPSPRSSASTS
jgi:hypothetical protein